MLRCARAVCGREGYHINDPEYGSAIGYAVWQAAIRWSPDREAKCKPTTLAVLYARRACKRVLKKLRRNTKHDMEVCVERSKPRWQPVPTPIPFTDHAFVEFVAAHGLGRSGKLLNMSQPAIRERLDEVVLRVDLSRREQSG
jgi:hypothetical protein